MTTEYELSIGRIPKINSGRLFPIDRVIATANVAGDQSPKAAALRALKPVAFVDDYLPFMVGVHTDIHSALIMRAINGSPNSGEHMQAVASTHASLLEFSGWWTRGGKGV